MCGIAGYYKVKPDHNEINSIIQKMNQSQIHRGPNSTNKFINKEKNLGLMMCRLSILDLEFGLQPMHSEDGRYTIIFNGTILNSPSLRSKLEEKKISFFTKNSDTEVLLKMLILKGKDCLKELNGSFAFAFYDNKTKKLLCARDRFGLKPFYYLNKNNKFLFASELKAILSSGYSDREVDKQSIFHYLSLLWVPGPNTIIKDIKKLQAGYFLELDLESGNLNIEKWWDFKIEPDYKVDKKEWPIRILDALKTSVKRSKLTDVPLSCGLSGGLDSQSIVGILSKDDVPPNTFTMAYEGYDEGHMNELNSSKIASQYFNTKHEEIIINQDEYFEDLSKMVFHLDEPYGGGLPLWHVLKEAGKNFGVILTGLGGDELFGNFGRWSLLERTHFAKFKSKFHFKKVFFDRKYFFSDELKKELLLEKENEYHKTSDFLYDNISSNKHGSIRDKIAYLDIKTQLSDEYCNMVDKFSMAHGIEARAPFLDNDLTDLIQKIPGEIRTSQNDFKGLLRESVKDIIPKENLYNRKRGFVGFESQKRNYDFKRLKNELFEEKKINRQGIFSYNILKDFLESIEANDRYLEKIEFGIFYKNYSYKSLWALIMLQMWLDIFIEKDFSFKFN